MRATAQESDGPLRWAIGKAIVVLIVGVVARDDDQLER